MKKHKKMKRRKRQVINSDFEHMVTARNDNCRQTIQQISKDHRIGFFTKGHAKNRLYFKCAEKRWNRFYADIRHLCFADNLVTCPTWLQKTMLKNLKKSSNNRLWPDRAQKAIEILKAISKKHDAPEAAVNIQPSTAAPSTQNKCSLEHVSTSGSRVKTLIQRIVYSISSCLKNFVGKLVSRRMVDGGALSGAGDGEYRIDTT